MGILLKVLKTVASEILNSQAVDTKSESVKSECKVEVGDDEGVEKRILWEEENRYGVNRREYLELDSGSRTIRRVIYESDPSSSATWTVYRYRVNWDDLKFEQRLWEQGGGSYDSGESFQYRDGVDLADWTVYEKSGDYTPAQIAEYKAEVERTLNFHNMANPSMRAFIFFNKVGNNQDFEFRKFVRLEIQRLKQGISGLLSDPTLPSRLSFHKIKENRYGYTTNSLMTSSEWLRALASHNVTGDDVRFVYVYLKDLHAYLGEVFEMNWIEPRG